MALREANQESGQFICTVIVCTHNRADRLPFCLNALAAQDFDPDRFELVVVDNASADSTRAVVEAHLPKFRHARYVYEPALGLSSARNRGIAEAQGEILAFTDDDCIPDSAWLTNTVAAFDALPNAGAVVGKIIPDFAAAPPLDWLDMNVAGSVLSCLDYADAVCELPVEYVRGASIAFARRAAEEAGSFRTDLGLKGKELLGNDETEFCMRLQERSYALVYTPHASVRHFIPKDRASQSYFLQRWFGQGQADFRTIRGRAAAERPGWLVVEAFEALRAIRQYFLARQRVRRLRQEAMLALTPDLFNRICMSTREAGDRREHMAHRFRRLADRVRGA